jgi:tetratricopeptide (TPR) repeat protein
VAFVGRARPLARLLAAVEGAAAGRAALVLVSGEAGIGKSTLIGEAAARAGLAVGWGTCRDAGRAPAFWPWSVALRALLDATGTDDARSLAADDASELARLLPELADAAAVADDAAETDAARLRLFDATARLLERLARRRPLIVVLDDLQWADPSTLALLEFVAQPHRPVPLAVVGAYRHDELTEDAARTLTVLAPRGEAIRLRGLDPAEVHDLVVATAGEAGGRWAADIHRRSAGHPFLVRQLAELLDDGAGPAAALPPAAQDLVRGRVARLSPPGRALLQAAALMGNELVPDVLAEVCELDAATVTALVDDAVRAGVLVRDGSGARMAHDLFRETVAADLPTPERLALHRRITEALEHRHARGGAVAPADLARHAAAAVPLAGPKAAVRWARVAAAGERARLAFAEAATHLARARRAVEDVGAAGAVLVDLLVEEGDARARAGDPAAARAVLDDAWARAGALGDPKRRGHVALGVQRLGARFAMPREDVVAALDEARSALHGTGTALEAQLTAALARELQHSVPAQRHRASPLSERALALARDLDDPTTLGACLLARHDALWTVGRAHERVAVAREVARVAARSGDAERHTEGLLLTANALLEGGSPAFRPALQEYLAAAERLGQPRHVYLARTRVAALALLDGRLDEAEDRITAAAALGERIGEPDTGNVRMSQLLGLAWARSDPDELRATAREAVRWWVGVPSHAHAVAAGLHVRAGDLDAGRRALDTVVSLGAWREDSSYLWSVFVGGMAAAAAALDDRRLCAELLPELAAVADTCGVNGALVCFTGSNAHWAGVLAAALGRTDDAHRHLDQARRVHERLGAAVWEVETRRALAALDPAADHAEQADRLAADLGLPAPRADAELRRDGDVWRVRYRDASAHLGALKGLADLATLLASPGRDVHVLDLVDAGPHDRASGPLLDGTAAAAYRRRLAELDEDLAEARAVRDTAREERCDAERAALLAELGRTAGLAGRARTLGSSTVERARKAVSGRLREAIGRIGAVLPELGAHLDRSVTTGTTCRYDPADRLVWRL